MRMAASAVKRLRQIPAVENKWLPTWILWKRLSIALDIKGVHSLSACTIVHTSSFVARSVILVNVEKSVKLRTNLIVGDGLL